MSSIWSHVRGGCSVAVVAMLAMLAGCASVPMASLESDSAAKQFQVAADKSRIYIYRNENMGGAIPMSLSVDGRMLGQSGPKTFFMVDVDPGSHTVSSHTENVSTLTVDAKAGKAHYIWQEVKMGMWSARSQLQEVDAATGQAGVAECKLAQPAN